MKVTALACLTSLCAYALDNGVLKIFFGVPNPYDTLTQGAHYQFHLFAGLSVEEAGTSVGVSRAAAYRHWKYARAWLRDALEK